VLLETKKRSSRGAWTEIEVWRMGLCEAAASAMGRGGGCGNCEGAADAIVEHGNWGLGDRREEEASGGAGERARGRSDGKRVRAVVGEVATVLWVCFVECN
jgi:hypothetical protein